MNIKVDLRSELTLLLDLLLLKSAPQFNEEQKPPVGCTFMTCVLFAC